MGNFQLNKKGEDPLKIYEDTFKIAEGTVETHLDKLGRMPKPISESKANESMGDEARTWWNSLSNSEKESTMDNTFGDISFLEENGYDYYDNQYNINDAFASLNVYKQVKSGSWDELEADHITNTFFRESKANEYDSMGMWDEMEVWWNSLPTSEQRDIIAKRGDGWELDSIDADGDGTDFDSLTDLQGDIVAPEYRLRNGLPEWSDVGLGTLKEVKANEIDARFWDNEMNIFDKLGALRDIGADTTDATITKKFSDLPKEIQDEISGFNTDYRIDESRASEYGEFDLPDDNVMNNDDYNPDDHYPREDYLQPQFYNMNYEDMVRLMVDQLKDYVERAMDSGNYNPASFDRVKSHIYQISTHSGLWDLPYSKMDTPEAKRAMDSAKDEAINWVRMKEQEAGATMPTPTWESKAKEFGGFVPQNDPFANDEPESYIQVNTDGTFTVYSETGQYGGDTQKTFKNYDDANDYKRRINNGGISQSELSNNDDKFDFGLTESWSEIESIANEDALGRWEDRVEPWESEDRARQYMAGQDDSELYPMSGGHTSDSNDGSFVNSMGYQLTNQGGRIHHIDLGDMTSNMPYDPTGQSYRDPVWDHTAGEPFSAIYTNDANVIPDVDWRGGLDNQGQSVPRSEWGRLEPEGYGKSQQDHYSWRDNSGGDTYNFDPWATPNG